MSLNSYQKTVLILKYLDTYKLDSDSSRINLEKSSLIQLFKNQDRSLIFSVVFCFS